MPEAVADWIENKNVENINSIQKEILSNYCKDFNKHTDNTTAVRTRGRLNSRQYNKSPIVHDSKSRIRRVFDSLPAQFAKNNDRFLYGVIKSGARAREYEIAIEWLVDAGIVRRVNHVYCGDKIPLKSYADISIFKLYFVDVGLFRYLAEIPLEVINSKTAIFNEFNGLIAEQFVLQQLSKYTLYFWTGSKISEVDFLMQNGSEIIPIEVKSGLNVKSKSLRVFRETYSPRLSVRFSLKDTRLDSGLQNISLFNIFLFDQLII